VTQLRAPTRGRPSDGGSRDSRRGPPALQTGRQIAPLTRRHSDFTIADGYRIARMICDLRTARGERPVGRKIGFTNPDAWPKFKADAPMWGYLYTSIRA